MIWWIVGVYLVMSAVTFVMYGVDKGRAQRAGGRKRIREKTLHGMELLGGWPGALAGRVVFQHKSRKVSYRVVFAAIVLLHAAAWLWLGMKLV